MTLDEAIRQLVAEEVERQLAERDVATNGRNPKPSPYMTVAEAAEFLRCREQRVRDLLSQRRLRTYKDGSRTLILRADVDAYVEGRG